VLFLAKEFHKNGALTYVTLTTFRVMMVYSIGTKTRQAGTPKDACESASDPLMKPTCSRQEQRTVCPTGKAFLQRVEAVKESRGIRYLIWATGKLDFSIDMTTFQVTHMEKTWNLTGFKECEY
jgi:hypothetical protein